MVCSIFLFLPFYFFYLMFPPYLGSIRNDRNSSGHHHRMHLENECRINQSEWALCFLVVSLAFQELLSPCLTISPHFPLLLGQMIPLAGPTTSFLQSDCEGTWAPCILSSHLHLPSMWPQAEPPLCHRVPCKLEIEVVCSC